MALRRLAGAWGVVVLAGTVWAGGPYGGTVRDLLLDARGRAPVWAATDRGLFRQGPQGWRRVEALAQSELEAVVDCGDRLLVARADGVLLASDDGGGTWNEAMGGLRGRFGHRAQEILCLVQDPGDRRHLYAGTAGKGTFESFDAGRRWTLRFAGLEAESPAAWHVAALVPPDGDAPLLAGTRGRGVFARVDGRWQPWGKGLPADLRVQTIAVEPGAPEHLLLGSRGEGLWESRDRGGTWARVRKGAYGVVQTVALAPGGRGLAHFPEEGLVVVEGGKATRPRHWRRVGVRDLVGRADGGWWAGLTHDGVGSVTADGVPGPASNLGLDAVKVFSLAPGREPGTWWCGDENGVFRSTDRGRTWQARDQGFLPSPALQLLRVGDDLYLGSGGQGVYLWDAEADKWAPRSKGLGTSNTIFSLDTDGARLYVATEGGILRSDLGGGQWVPKGQGLPKAGVWRLAASRKTSGRLWADGAGALFRSDDGGDTWGEVARTRAVQLVVETTGTGERLWVVENRRLLRIDPEGPLEVVSSHDGPERFTCILPGPGGVWVGATDGLWRLDETELSHAWGGAGILSLRLDDDSRLVAGTDGAGVVTFRFGR